MAASMSLGYQLGKTARPSSVVEPGSAAKLAGSSLRRSRQRLEPATARHGDDDEKRLSLPRVGLRARDGAAHDAVDSGAQARPARRDDAGPHDAHAADPWGDERSRDPRDRGAGFPRRGSRTDL